MQNYQDLFDHILNKYKSALKRRTLPNLTIADKINAIDTVYNVDKQWCKEIYAIALDECTSDIVAISIVTGNASKAIQQDITISTYELAKGVLNDEFQQYLDEIKPIKSDSRQSYFDDIRSRMNRSPLGAMFA